MKRPGKIDWASLRTVLVASRAKSFLAAAGTLGVNESTVSRHIASVERSMRVVLFHRTPAGIVLTESGRALVSHLELAERQIGEGVETLAGALGEIAGTVRVTAVPLLINHLLIPHLPALTAAHPGLIVELVATPSDLSLTRRETDIALRLARPKSEMTAITRRLGQLDYGVYAAARYRWTTVKHLPWIGYIPEMRDLPQAAWLERQMRATPRGITPAATTSAGTAATGAIRVNDAESVPAAVRQGLGRSLLPSLIGAGDPGIRRHDRFDDLPARELWLLYHPDIRGFRRFQIVLDWIDGLTQPMR